MTSKNDGGTSDLAKAIKEMFLEAAEERITDLTFLVSPGYIDHLKKQGVPIPEGAKLVTQVKETARPRSEWAYEIADAMLAARESKS